LQPPGATGRPRPVPFRLERRTGRVTPKLRSDSRPSVVNAAVPSGNTLVEDDQWHPAKSADNSSPILPRARAMLTRHLLSWKTLFYDARLPALSPLGPAAGDAVLGALGRLAHAAWPPRIKVLAGAAARLGPGFDSPAMRAALAANVARFLARDYPLDGRPD